MTSNPTLTHARFVNMVELTVRMFGVFWSFENVVDPERFPMDLDEQAWWQMYAAYLVTRRKMSPSIAVGILGGIPCEEIREAEKILT